MSTVKDLFVVPLKLCIVSPGAEEHHATWAPRAPQSPGNLKPHTWASKFHLALSFWDVSPLNPSEMPHKLLSLALMTITCPGLDLSFWTFLSSPCIPPFTPVLPRTACLWLICLESLETLYKHLRLCKFCLSPKPLKCSLGDFFLSSCSLLVLFLKGEGETFRAQFPPRSHQNRPQSLHM